MTDKAVDMLVAIICKHSIHERNHYEQRAQILLKASFDA
jgi:hypothetical protein